MRPGAGGFSLEDFTGRMLVTLVIGAIAAALWQRSDILILLFGAVLLLIGLRAAARLTMRRTGLPRSLALAAIVLLTLSVFGSALWVFGATVGVLLAAPLTLFVRASVELLYVQEGLGELPEPKATDPSLGAAAVEV